MTDGNGNTTAVLPVRRPQAADRDHLSRLDHQDQHLRRPRQPGLRHRPGRQRGPVHLRRGQPVDRPWSQVNSPNTPANTTIYGYDDLGNPIALEDANSHTTASSFDLLERADREDSARRHADRDAAPTTTAAICVTVTHFNGVTTTYTYDSSQSAAVSAPRPGEATVSFTYTATGKRADNDGRAAARRTTATTAWTG